MTQKPRGETLLTVNERISYQMMLHWISIELEKNQKEKKSEEEEFEEEGGRGGVGGIGQKKKKNKKKREDGRRKK